MSADTWMILDTKTFEIIYGQGNGCGAKVYQGRNLENAVEKARRLQNKYHPEYGIILK